MPAPADLRSGQAMAAVSSMVTAAATAAAVYVLMRPSKQVNSDNVNAATTHAAEDKSSNPALQLPTPDQVGHISRTWALVKDSVGLQKAGELFFHTLFEAHPEALGLFTKFKDEPKWQESATFKEHALRVISTVDTAFGMLGDLDQLVPILQRLGKAHVGYGAQPQHYDWVGAALVGTLQTALGPKMTAEVTEAYVVVYTVVKTVMLGGAAEATAPTHPSVQDLLGPDDHHDHEMPKLDGVTGAAVAIDPKDHDSPDDWVPRRREMIRLTGLHPFNSEPPLSVMMKEGFFTSPGLHYIRNHGAVPNLSWESHTIQLQTDDGTVVHELTMDELAAFPTRTLPITMNCAGNRRKEQNVIKKTKGFSWGAAAVGTSYWTGVLLRDLLLHYGLVTEEEFFKPHPDRLHVCFAGVDELPAGIYGTSIPMSVALDPTRECMIAYKQNGALLTPDHGFPVRTMLPGMIGGRMIKWLGSIRICRTESTDFYHYYDNRVMPPMYDETNITDEVWKDPSYIINDRNLNSAITRPAHNEQISLATARKQKMYTVKGYAYMGAGQRISRVEITLNEGDTWEVCTLYTEEKPTKWGKSWCWVFWSLEVETTRLLQCETLAVRCWDQSTNSQPGKLTWSILGMMNNCWFRVKMKQIGNGNDKTEVRCLHPAVVDGDMKGWMVEEKEALEAPATVLTSAPVADDNAPSYPLEEIAKHSTEDDCWIILHGKVYDTSEFMADHPGGGNSILKVTGTDSSQVFDAIHSQKAHAMLADYEIGVVASSPALQLPTPDQVGHISRTWALVKDSVGLQKAGELFFHTLFEAHPEALGLFTKFKDEPKWQESATFKEHALRVISTVDTAFEMLGDLDQLVPILQRLGKAHVGYGAQPQHYDWVGAALVGTLQTALGPKMTAEVTEAYVVVYTVVKTVMLGGAAEDCPEDGSANDRKDDSASGFTLAQVAAHDKVEDCWTVVHGEVYDITGFMEDHPGGKALLMMYAGKVADEGFDPIHPFSILEEHRNKGVVHLGKLSATEMAKVSASTPADNPAQDVKVLELDQCLNLYDLEHVAKSKMKLSAFNYYATGATDMFTVDGNQEIYRSIRLCPRVMVDVTDTSTTSSILGNATAMPIYVSASAKGGLAHKDAEIGLARACQTHDVVQMVPHLGTKSIDDCAAVRQQNQAQFVQIYVESDRNATEALVKQMEACGFAGLFVTVDSSGTGKRELDLRSTPGGSAPKTNNNLDGSNASKPTIKKRRWASDMTWDDIAWFRSITKMPIVLKGIQTGEDALLAYHHGVDGIVVSNHGGRQVDTARPSLECLVEVMAALRTVEPTFPYSREFEVFVDGGIKRGTDVFKALALGATAVGIGRAALYGLAAFGQAGVEATLQILQEELYTTMQFMGTPTVADIREARLEGIDKLRSSQSYEETYAKGAADIVPAAGGESAALAAPKAVQLSASRPSITDLHVEMLGLDPSFDANTAVQEVTPVEIHCEPAPSQQQPKSLKSKKKKKKASLAEEGGHNEPTDNRKTVVVIGLSMVGWRFCEALVENDSDKQYRIVSFCEEPRLAYNRVGLGQMFDHGEPDQLLMAEESWYRESGITVLTGHKAVNIDRSRQVVSSDKGTEVHYDIVVMATGSYAWVPPIPGADTCKNVFVYRTIEDCQKITAAASKCTSAAVIGGGLLGLEGAKACYDKKVESVYVIEGGKGLMSRQLDETGSDLLRAKIEALAEAPQNINVVPAARPQRLIADKNGAVCGIDLTTANEQRTIDCQMVVICTGIRPRDELARECGLEVGTRGGIVVNDILQTSDPNIFAIGEVACHKGMCYGLVAPGYEMADVVAKQLTGVEVKPFTSGDLSAKLKLMGVDVAAFGIYNGHPQWESAKHFSYFDPFKQVYKNLLFDSAGKKLLGGMLVGDTSDYGKLLMMSKSDMELECQPDELVHGRSAPTGDGAGELADDAQVCSCNNVTKGHISKAICDGGLTAVGEVSGCTKAGKGCGGCMPMVTDILKAELKKRGGKITNHICPHFSYSRGELCTIVKVKQLKTFAEVLESCGNGGNGCEHCKPCVAGILASLWNDSVMKQVHRPQQDTNDRYLANIQRGGSYSVVPRSPGGEILPEQLITIGTVAKKYGLYSKITGSQRVDLFGAAVHQLPDIWKELIDVGLESGAAYAKGLRMVKSCVGSSWCRYGIGDSVGFAVQLENRYKGIRSPHKLKGAVSGCVRECAEAQSKDFGLIAVQGGFNIYVCGNGGVKPRHATLLAETVEQDMCVRYLDRFLMYYILTADKLQRTAPWLEKMEGGIEHLRDVVILDTLGICDELERRMGELVGSYECEWKAVVNDPERVKHFKQFVNTSETEKGIAWKEPAEGRPGPIPVDWPPITKNPPWQAKHINISYDDDTRAKETSSGAVANTAEIEIDNEHGPRKLSWPLSWIKVGKENDFLPEAGSAIKYGKSQLAVFNFASRGEWYATQNMCPHKRTIALSRGLIGDKSGAPSVACPVHKKTFALDSGQSISDPETYHILTFRAKAEDGDVLVELPSEEDLDNVLATSKTEIHDHGCGGSCGDEKFTW